LKFNIRIQAIKLIIPDGQNGKCCRIATYFIFLTVPSITAEVLGHAVMSLKFNIRIQAIKLIIPDGQNGKCCRIATYFIFLT
ncbi:hypothetical protein C7D71_30820, partial [Klebsiella pneumoniae]